MFLEDSQQEFLRGGDHYPEHLKYSVGFKS